MSAAHGRGGGMRGALLVAGLLALIGGGAGLVVWLEDDHEAPADVTAEDSAGVPAREPTAPKPAPKRNPRRRAEPPPDPMIAIEGAWQAAQALMKKGKILEALTQLAALRRQYPAFFAEPARAKLIAEMERAALAELARVARTRPLEEARLLAEEIGSLVLDPGRAEEAKQLLAGAGRSASVAVANPGAAIVARAQVPADREGLARHLQRFAGEGAPAATRDWVDDQLASVGTANAARAKDPAPLAIPDVDEAETRRLDQLEKLRQRDAVGLLDNIGGALAWLALHQAEDGHFGADAAGERCTALAHDPPCVPPKSAEKFPLGTTGLAVLAFLDFRDQDVKRLFEPTLARGLRWLRAQQEESGAFKLPHGAGYSAAIALMAVGQAAASSRDEELRDAIDRGIRFYALHAGPNGGYRYTRDSEGDLSVSGWYAQAGEAAALAGVEFPPQLRANLERFLTAHTKSETAYFYVTTEKGPRPGLAPVGMLTASILKPELQRAQGDAWRAALVKAPPKGNTYALYYAVRVLLALDGEVPEAFRTSLEELTKDQQAKGPAAGLFTLEKDAWLSRRYASVVAATAFAALTLEHSLYRR